MDFSKFPCKYNTDEPLELDENLIPCIFNDLQNNSYSCPYKEIPSYCQKTYESIMSQLIDLDTDISKLEKKLKIKPQKKDE